MVVHGDGLKYALSLCVGGGWCGLCVCDVELKGVWRENTNHDSKGK